MPDLAQSNPDTDLTLGLHVSRLADQGATLTGRVPVVRFARLCDLLVGSGGDVHITLRFTRARRQRAKISAHATATLDLSCQVCLEPVRCEIDTSCKLLVVGSEEELLGLNKEEDGIVCADDVVSVQTIVEDELLVALPMVARHPGNCALPVATAPDNVDDEPDMAEARARPFADLREQLSEHGHGGSATAREQT